MLGKTRIDLIMDMNCVKKVLLDNFCADDFLSVV